MADQKVSDLPALNGADVDAADLLYIVDSSAGSAGSKKITVGQYQLAPVSGGTANGVAYLNASKVLTTGSALTFDGTNLGIGTSSPAQRLDVTGAVNSVQARFGNVAGRGLEIGTSIISGTNDAGSVLNAKGATSGTMIFQTDSTERMRLDASGNLGIGTSSPATKLHVNTGAAGYGITVAALSQTSRTYQFGIDSNSNFAIYESVAATQRVVLDQSGNLGLGVTPSAAIAGTTIEVGVNKSGAFGALGSGPVDNAYVSANAYPTGSADPAFTSWKYTRNGFAAKYEAGRGGAHQWFTAPSGTAGTAISFTQAMTLDASGNLGVGTTSPGAKLDVSDSTGANLLRLVRGSDQVAGYISSNVAFWGTLTNTPLAFSTNNTERARITSGGDLQAYGAVALWPSSSGGAGSYSIKRAATNALTFNYDFSGAELARFTSGGDLLVGTTTTVGAGGITLFNNGSTGFSLVNNNNAAPTGYVFESFRRSSTEIGSVTQNGTTGVLFNTTSDRRLKQNIVPAPSASAAIDAIQIVSHDWKSAPDEHVTYGVIAQDLALVAPQAVLQGDNGDEIEKTWGVDYSKLVPMLIKEIQSLRARVAALESA